MKPDATELRRHYAAMSDEALLTIERSDLTEIAQRCYDDEICKRRIQPAEEPEEPADEVALEVEADWLENAACACSFEQQKPQDLEQACQILEDANILYHVKSHQEEPQPGYPYTVFEVMVPSGLLLHAISVLDKDMFNPRQEAEWQAHFEELSEDDFDAIRIDDLTAGMLDRVERLKRVYAEERARRK
jgi:hypothetical protein